MRGNNGSSVGELRFTEYKGKHWNVEIHIRYSQDLPCLTRRARHQFLEDFRGMILAALLIEGKFRLHAARLDGTSHPQMPGQALSQRLPQGMVNAADGHQGDDLHCVA